jgi:ethanolamine ammonia-lyase small subunit
LAFQLAHAEARDAVHAAFKPSKLVQPLRARNISSVLLHSSACDRRAYLLRPDLGRKLDDASAARLAPFAGGYDVAFVIVDGLSARAIHSHAIPFLDDALSIFHRNNDWKVGPTCLVEQGRVAIGDEIGQILGAKLIVVMIGERPGLTSPDSLGIYLTYAPRVGRSDAERNCLSNIRPNGLPYQEAAKRLGYLCNEARSRELTGFALKDESHDGFSALTQASRLTSSGGLGD